MCDALLIEQNNQHLLIQEPIGKGTFTVYKGVLKTFGINPWSTYEEKVAVKIIPKSFTNSHGIELREKESLIFLIKPENVKSHIVKFKDEFEDVNNFYFIMEFIEGVTLRSFLD